MRKKLTITVAEDVYEGLHKVVGRRHISEFLEALARPHVLSGDLDSGYAAMAADEQRERTAEEWAELGAADGARECGEDDATR